MTMFVPPDNDPLQQIWQRRGEDPEADMQNEEEHLQLAREALKEHPRHMWAHLIEVSIINERFRRAWARVDAELAKVAEELHKAG